MLKNEDNVPPVEKLGRTNKIFCIRHYLGDSSNKELALRYKDTILK